MDMNSGLVFSLVTLLLFLLVIIFFAVFQPHNLNNFLSFIITLIGLGAIVVIAAIIIGAIAVLVSWYGLGSGVSAALEQFLDKLPTGDVVGIRNGIAGGLRSAATTVTGR